MFIPGNKLEDPELLFLSELCEHPLKNWNRHNTILDIVTAAEDTVAWVNDMRTYSPKHQDSWTGSIKDLWRAVDALGPRVKVELGPSISNLRTALAKMPDNATDRAEKKKAQEAMAEFVARLLEPTTVDASWRDFVEASENPRISWGKLMQYRDTVWALVKEIGHSLKSGSAATTVQAILHDQNLHVVNAKISTGMVPPSSIQGLEDPWGPAGLTKEERIELCGSFLGSPTHPTAHNVLWFAFDQADAPAMRAKYGMIQIFDSQWLYGNLVKDGPSKQELPEELLRGGFFEADYLPHGRGIALMRVDLGQSRLAEAHSQAEEIAKTLVEFVRPWDSTPWQLRSGYLHSINGHIRGFGNFGVDEQMEKDRWVYSNLGANLHDLAPRISSHLSTMAPEFRQVVQAKQWLHEAGKASEPARLLLTVRVLELHASWISGGQDAWINYSKRNLKHAWVMDTLRGLYVTRLREALVGAGFQTFPDEESKRMREIFLKFQHSEGHDRYSFTLSEATPHIDWLANVYGPQTRVGRELSDLAQKISSPRHLRQLTDRKGRDFNRQLERLHRLRNAIAHGGPVPQKTIVSTVNFGSYLAERSLQTTMNIVIDGKDLIAGHADAKNLQDSIYEKMRREGVIPD